MMIYNGTGRYGLDMEGGIIPFFITLLPIALAVIVLAFAGIRMIRDSEQANA